MEESTIKKCNGQSGDDGNKFLRTRRIEVRVSPEEYELIKARGTNQGFRHMAQYLRQSAMYAGEIDSPMASKKALLATQYELNRIGNNINQISRALNSGNEPDEEMKLMLMQILEIAEQLVADASKGKKVGGQ
jgi:hypothetical protein